MDTPQMDATLKTRQRRKGQTMAEFAITLPILLILVFGVIEFGRVFQAWVTLQNSARAAARYASTGRFNEAKYPVTENREQDPDSIVDCVLNDDKRGSQTTLNVEGETVRIYQGGAESLFATWYDGENCEPNRIDHQDLRKDIARILSITDEARRGAAGLALGPDPLANVDTQSEVEDWLYSQWARPLPGNGVYNFHEGWDQPAYFDVMICSSRGPRNDASGSYYQNVGTRFYTALDARDFAEAQIFSGGADLKNDQRAPVCVLNEAVPLDGGALQNAGVPWLDAGGPGDAVTVVVTFNHPLITPLGLAPYVQLQARRAAVNEAFRAAEATGALQGGAPLTADLPLVPLAVLKINNPNLKVPENLLEVQPGDLDPFGAYPVILDGSASRDDDGPNGKPVLYIYELLLTDGSKLELARLPYPNGELPDPDTPITGKPEGRFHFAPGTYTVILTVKDNEGQDANTSITFTVALPPPPVPPSDTPTPTLTPTGIPPFQCDLIKAGNVSFFNNRVFIQIENANFLATTLSQVDFHWRKISQFPNMYVAGMSLDGQLHWRGQDKEPSTNTHSPADPSTPADLFFSADRTIAGEDTVAWEAVFSNGPAPIQDTANNIIWMTPDFFNGSTWTFENPEGGSPCVIPLIGPTPTSTNTPVNPNITPSATWTPDCAGTDVTIRYSNFDTFGVVRILITNNRPVTANFTDFNINWVKRAAGPQVLERVVAGGSSAADLTNGTLIWQGGSGQDANPPTLAGTTAASASGREGTWVTNYSFPPLSTTNLWIKFGVTNSTPDTAFGMTPSDLNGSWFQIGCGTPPDGQNGQGNWYGGDGRITIFQEPTPRPTNTPGPSNTPAPTYTPSKTFTPAPPTNTPLPPTVTNTPKPTNTKAPTPTPTEVPPGGPSDDGNTDG